MKRLLIIALAALIGSSALAQSPKSNLRPDETVLLYCDALGETPDVVYAKKIIPAGFKMEVDNKVDRPESISQGGVLSDI